MKPFILFSFLLLTLSGFGQINQGLVAYWPLDGNANDISGNGYHGTVQGYMQKVEGYSGANSCALSTVSSGSYIKVLKTIEVDSTKGVSISFWAKTNLNANGYKVASPDAWFAYSTWPIRFDTTAGQGKPIGVEDQREGVLESPNCSLYVAKRPDIVGDYNLSNCSADWMHYVVIFKQPTLTSYDFEMYRNNEKLHSLGRLDAGIRNKLIVELARSNQYFVRDYLNGSSQDTDVSVLTGFEFALDEFRIYNRELTSADVNDLYMLNTFCTVTSLEEETQKTEKPSVVGAFNLLGQSIPTIESYTGPAILLYSDGSRKKVIK